MRFAQHGNHTHHHGKRGDNSGHADGCTVQAMLDHYGYIREAGYDPKIIEAAKGETHCHSARRCLLFVLLCLYQRGKLVSCDLSTTTPRGLLDSLPSNNKRHFKRSVEFDKL
jgi:hypothetical protein